MADYVRYNPTQLTYQGVLTMFTYTVFSYETAEFEICMQAVKGGRARAMYHAQRRARYWEQDITCFRILGEGLSYESAMALLRTAHAGEGVKVMP